MMEQRIIDAVKAAGFEVWMRDPSDSYMIFTDGKRLGYLQAAGGAISLTTVHAPNQTTGTGFKIDDLIDKIDAPTLERAFVKWPTWASMRDRETVKKFRDIEHFRQSSAWCAGYKRV